MATQTRKQLEDQISDLCEQAGCNQKIKGIHKTQYVDRRWNPHPPQRFTYWWNGVGAEMTERATGYGWRVIDSVRAFNCEVVREAYSEAKQTGIVA